MADYLYQHRPHFGVPYYVNLKNVQVGDVITFRYAGEYSPKPILRWVFVLDPDWEGKLHGLTLNLTPRKVITDEVVGAMFQEDVPRELYIPTIQHIAKEYDSYRTYFLKNMSGVRRYGYRLFDK